MQQLEGVAYKPNTDTPTSPERIRIRTPHFQVDALLAVYLAEITAEAERDLEQLDKPVAKRIRKRIQWLADHFEQVTPEPLSGPLKELYKLRDESSNGQKKTRRVFAESDLAGLACLPMCAVLYLIPTPSPQEEPCPHSTRSCKTQWRNCTKTNACVPT